MRSLSILFAATLFVFPVASQLQAADLVGTLPGDFSVDNKGTANYSIPLAVPPGINGMQPSLSLNYNSSVGNGVMGVGWNFSTGSMRITRGRTILARHGVVDPLDYDENDMYFLNGKLLIQTNPSFSEYHKSGAEYRTEVDSFAHIEAFSESENDDEEIDYFLIRFKDGRNAFLGKYDADGDNQFEADGLEIHSYDPQNPQSVPYAYHLKKLENLVGQSVIYNYTLYTGGEHVLDEIKYGLSHEFSIGLHYNEDIFVDDAVTTTRNDRNTAIVGGYSDPMTKRLDRITVGKSGDDLHEYKMRYRYSSVNGRLLLESLHPRFKKSLSNPIWDELNPHSFQYSNWSSTPTTGGETYHVKSIDNDFNFNQEGDFKFASSIDIDGDGKHEWLIPNSQDGKLYAYRFTVATSGVDGQDRAVSVSGSMVLGDYGGVFTKINPTFSYSQRIYDVADVNFDGFDDVIHFKMDDLVTDGIYIAYSNGTTFGVPVKVASFEDAIPGNPLYGDNLDPYYGFAAGDMDGDGAIDLVCSEEQRPYLLYAQGDDPVLDDDASNVDIYVARGNGDGSFQAWKLFSRIEVLTQEFTSACPSLNNETGEVLATLDLLDVNHDGLLDIRYSTSVSFHYNYYPELNNRTNDYLISNNGVDPVTRAVIGETQSAPDYWSSFDSTDGVGFLLTYGDLNGDGYTDNIILDYGYLDDPYSLDPDTIGDFSVKVRMGNGGNGGEKVISDENDSTSVKVVYNGDYLICLSNASVDKIDLNEGTGLPEDIYYSLGGSPSAMITDLNGDGYGDYCWQPDWSECFVLYGGEGGFRDVVGVDGTVEATLVPELEDFATDAFLKYPRLDINGDGHQDLIDSDKILLHREGRPDLLVSVIDSLGQTNEIEYLPITDQKVYEVGAITAYPIRNDRTGHYVVSELFRDSGVALDINDDDGDGRTDDLDRAQAYHISYQYSGRRTDLSGRGDLGFHSFVTLDHQTGLFKYQFLEQSFPMTGLTKREQTYRALNWDKLDPHDFDLRIVSWKDNSVIADLVVDVLDQAYGTIFPMITASLEHRWEDGTTAHYSYTASNPTGNQFSDVEDLFIQGLPLSQEPYSTIRAQTWFDDQADSDEDNTELPAAFETNTFGQ